MTILEARWLTAPPVDDVVPPMFAAMPVPTPTVTREAAAAVPVADCGEPMTVVTHVPTWPVYEQSPLPGRGPLRLRAGLWRRLVAAHLALPDPFGLMVLDGWRSPAFQGDLLAHHTRLDPELGDGWVSDPTCGPPAPHTTGGAVDLTLTWRGVPLALGTDFDSFDPAAFPAALEGRPGLDRDLRRLLSAVLRVRGLTVHPMEWWHWSYGDSWWAAATGAEHALYGTVAHT